ncbi:MAG TPA: hypothetical protein PKD04_00685 [Rhodocyclaceae bacterium]|nr:hypothetical protein [Betaproteobacteria bacterium]HMU99562.1 hypothetical protein [Rhodocyclaceae bacterium]HMV20544.1 hypothetical protein [Rhodocyclaceae bacterium]HMW77444.1 hypothetical protein [Rhodocyclaceae bacterium]HNE41844.1 hypothetical protein [Rhodocyclaceae bacterium]
MAFPVWDWVEAPPRQGRILIHPDRAVTRSPGSLDLKDEASGSPGNN